MKKHEVEAKFICRPDLTERHLEQVLVLLGSRVIWTDTINQVDIYFDSPNDALRRTGLALRLRHAGEKSVGTLKITESHLGAVFNRKEIEWPAPHEQERSWFDETRRQFPTAVESTLKKLGVGSLESVLTVSSTRRKATVSSSASPITAELAIDAVKFRGSRRESPRRELELELVSGDSSELLEFAKTIAERLELEPSNESKFTAGMKSVGRMSNRFL